MCVTLKAIDQNVQHFGYVYEQVLVVVTVVVVVVIVVVVVVVDKARNCLKQFINWDCELVNKFTANIFLHINNIKTTAIFTVAFQWKFLLFILFHITTWEKGSVYICTLIYICMLYIHIIFLFAILFLIFMSHHDDADNDVSWNYSYFYLL